MQKAVCLSASLSPVAQIHKNKDILFLSMVPSPYCPEPIFVHNKYLDNCRINWIFRMDRGAFPVWIDSSV